MSPERGRKTSEAVNFSPGYLREGKTTRRGPHGEI